MESLNEAQGVGTKWAVDRELGGNLESFVIRREVATCVGPI